jgi:hypothetical protein
LRFLNAQLWFATPHPIAMGLYLVRNFALEHDSNPIKLNPSTIRLTWLTDHPAEIRFAKTSIKAS